MLPAQLHLALHDPRDIKEIVDQPHEVLHLALHGLPGSLADGGIAAMNTVRSRWVPAGGEFQVLLEEAFDVLVTIAGGP